MGLLSDSYTLFTREMLIFKANLRTNIVRSAIFPLFIILIFGNINTTYKNTPVAIVNYANNPQSLAFINDLQINNDVNLVTVTNQQNALQMLQTGQVQAIIVILPTYPTLSPGVKGVQVYYSNTQVSVVAALLPVVNATAVQASGLVAPKPQTVPVSMVQSDAVYAGQSSYKTFLAAGIIPMVVIFSALFAGGLSMITDRQMGNLKAFLITPINKNAIIIGRVISSGVQGAFSALIALAIGIAFGAGVAMGTIGVVWLIVVAFLVTIGFVGLAMIIASRVKRVDAYAIFSQAIGLPLWYAAGGITPIASLPSWILPVTTIDPLTYATQITRGVMMQGFIPFNELVFDLALLTGIGLVFLFISMRMFKSTLD